MRLRAEQRLRRQVDFQETRQGHRHDCGAFVVWMRRRPPPGSSPVPAAATDSGQAAFSRPAEVLPSGDAVFPDAGQPRRTADTAASASGADQPPPPARRPPVSRALAPQLVRFGFVASKAQVGRAVLRNRAKRRLRALCRELQPLVPAGVDVIVLARRGVLELPALELATRYRSACERLTRLLRSR